MSTGRLHCPICGRFRCGPLFHRRCQAERTQLTGLVLEAIHKQQEAESEEFTKAIACVQNSWLVARRGVGSSELLEQIYKAVVDTWYLKADTADFAFYQSYLAHFQRRAAIRLEQPYERHRRLQLLHHLQHQQSPIPDCYLMPAPPGTRPYVKAVAQTSKSLQVEFRNLNYSGVLALCAIVFAVAGGISTLLPVPGPASLILTVALVFGTALSDVRMGTPLPGRSWQLFR